ncbi:MAG TPA: NAD(P)H-dependent oxidoreductase [Pseudolysinimonas sp.]|nr:NAD(P)H-dependent oxidoreductase [Pseudolysinimonas sp.]
MTRILVINAHPDPSPERLAFALTDAYVRGAEKGGHEIRRVELAKTGFPLVTNTFDVEGTPPDTVTALQDDVTWAEHLVFVFPLWIGGPPWLLKAYFEQIGRYDFAFDHAYKPLLKGRSSRFIVTSSLPTIMFRVLFAQSTKGLIRAGLWSAGIRPTRILSLGAVETADKAPWFAKLEKLGAAGK